MRDLPENKYALSLFGPSCDVATGTFAPFIHHEEGNRVVIPCENPLRKNIVTCKDPTRGAFLAEVGGLALNTKLTSQIEMLTPDIPVLDFGTSNIKNIPDNYPVVGLTLHDIMAKGVKYRAGNYQEQPEMKFRLDILSRDSFVNKKVILFLTGPDTLIEWVWYNRERYKFFKVIKEMGFWAVGGFNFSVIDGECAFAHALNQKRSLFSAALAEQQGLLALPHVYSINQYQTDRWIAWFSKNPTVRLFTVNCQLQKSDSDICQIVRFVTEILKVNPELRVLLQGFHCDKLSLFGQAIDRIHLADKVAAKYSQIGRDVLSNKIIRKQPKSDIPKRNQFFVQNLYSRFLELKQIRDNIKHNPSKA